MWICAGVERFGGEDAVVVASDFLRDDTGGTSDGGSFAAALRVLQAFWAAILFVRVVAIMAVRVLVGERLQLDGWGDLALGGGFVCPLGRELGQ